MHLEKHSVLHHRLCTDLGVGFFHSYGVFDIPVLVFLHHHNIVGPGSTLQLTSHVAVMSQLCNGGEKEKKIALFL